MRRGVRAPAPHAVPYTFTLARRNPNLNPRLSRLQPYPFERLRQWLAGIMPNPALAPIDLSIGEPRHPTPALVLEALAAAARGLANYPTCDVDGTNPGRGYVRNALVAGRNDCAEAVDRMLTLARAL